MNDFKFISVTLQ